MKTIFIGPFGNGGIPKDGASIKNYHILNKIRSNSHDFLAIDTENWKKRPGMLIYLLWTIILNPKARYILSLNNSSAHRVIQIINLLAPKATVIYWVIGGSIGKWMQDGQLNPKDYSHLNRIIVEGSTMKSELEACGLTSAVVMPNFKKIINVPIQKKAQGKIRFIFLSRIIPEKGCNLILDAAKQLNNEGLTSDYEIDFYGPIQEDYKVEFNQKVKGFPNVKYKGFLDLRNTANYTELAKYDAMLFPTFWPGEGCPGIVIDAYMCRLPILGSDWNMNHDYIEHGKNGILFKANSQQALTDTLRDAVLGKFNLDAMGSNALESVGLYNIETVLSDENLKKLNIID